MNDWYTLTGFGDEISPHFEEQLDLLKCEEIDYIELRSIERKEVLDLSEQELRETKNKMRQKGVRVSCLASSIGKVSIDEDFGIHLKKFKRALDLAFFFETKYIRLFSYYIPPGKEPARFREEVIERMKIKTELAEERDVILLHENEKRIYGDTPERCLDILKTINSVHLRAIFDPANFVQIKVNPMKDAFPLLCSYVKYVHIKDALFDTGKVVLPGEGHGNIEEILRMLKLKNFRGFLSLEPHLVVAGEKGGFTGKGNFRKAISALRNILRKKLQ